ncbi:4-alpha-glucanotransferase [Bacillus benzoevorans]|uniref:4-alpha-glucanotransferase n=1 Tax=Bacillus benzoevorans TaxID=1456 RepID=A0A7X0HTL2_9BACI|nr:4-alpha-glucanotransferase [Bacillus benzoevorans]
MLRNRSSGILLHLSSLPNPYGIGTFGKEAYDFVDFLKKAGQTYWQILPLNPVAEGNSPYSTYSAFALNPYFIDLDLLKKDELLQESDYQHLDFGSDPTKVDYVKITQNKMNILMLAYENRKAKSLDGWNSFVATNREWIDNYAAFMSIRSYFNDSLQNWDAEVKRKNAAFYSLLEKDEVDFWIFLQYLCQKQWMSLKKYANDQGIHIFGDMPIYVSGDSADVWANPEVFDVDADLQPLHVAGCPPDDFAVDGQRWGMPVFQWDFLIKNDFAWWMKRLKRNLQLYDCMRIDHFRGLESFYSIPAGEPTARNGRWVKACGREFFAKIKEQFGDVDIILEDLGFITQEVMDLKKYTGFPGMKVLQFAFLSDANNPYLPHHCERNSVIYTSSHDNDTLLGWFSHASEYEKRFLTSYLGTSAEDDIVWACIEKVMSAESMLSIIPLQDFLQLDSEARMNIPGTTYGNWVWRVQREAFDSELAQKIHETTKKYNR